ncbi:thiol reductant ABC exporter subunit CydC [Chlorobium sp.]|uniref:thiol reductant ABC exporter subunit CydC n=1 Tax=Chlorobium sp. TaxID=1095 RepID=UPI002F425E10
MKTFLRLAGLVRPFFWWMLLAAIAGFAATGSGIGLLMTSAYIIAKAALQPPMSDIQLGIVGVRFFGIARGALRYAERLISHDATFRILARLRLWFYDALEPLAPARLLAFRSGDLLQRIVDDIQSLENIYARVLAPPVTAVMTALLIWFLIGIWSPEAALVTLGFQLAAGIGLPLLAAGLGRGFGRRITELRARQQTETVDFTQGLGELRVYGQLDACLERMKANEAEILWLQKKNAWIEGMQESLVGICMNGALIGVLLVLLPSVPSGQLSGITLSVIMLAVMASFEAFAPLPAAAGHIEADIHAGKRLFDIIDAKPEVSAPQEPQPFPAQHDIRMRNLTFSYPGSPDKTLDGVTIDIPEGLHVAIVGPSGAGKSTIAALLVRFWNAAPGELVIGGTDIGAFDPEELRRNLSLVSQRTYLFGETIRENLLLAKPDASDTELAEALESAGIGHFTSRLQDWAGQHGMQLSGGERQRIAIARMILQNAPIVILDEATASLDMPTDRAVTRTIDTLTDGKTLLTITHRLYNMERFDTIYVLDKGKVTEKGTHAELLHRNGLYRQMWELQHEETPAV